MSDIIDLNVGGQIYTTTRTTLTRYPTSMLGCMFSDRLPSAVDKHGNYVIDRDGQMFRHVLNFLRTSQLILPKDFREHELLNAEADFYQIPDLIEALSGCKGPEGVAKTVEEIDSDMYVERRVLKQNAPRHRPTNTDIFDDWIICGNEQNILVFISTFSETII